MKTTSTLATACTTINGMPIENLKGVNIHEHEGVFNADDVCCVALLELLAGRELEIHRVDDFSTEHMVIDIDRHKDGIPMTGVGLITKDILIDGKTIEELFPGFTEKVLKHIETKNNVCTTGCSSKEINDTSFCDIINAFNPGWDSELSSDECFREAVDITKVILDKFLMRIKSRETAAEVVKNAEVVNNVIILDKFVPWQTCIDDNIVGCIYPSNRGGWYLELAPGMFKFETGMLSFKNRGKFEFDEYAESLTTFMHASGLMCMTRSKYDAIALTKYITSVN